MKACIFITVLVLPLLLVNKGMFEVRGGAQWELARDLILPVPVLWYLLQSQLRHAHTHLGPAHWTARIKARHSLLCQQAPSSLIPTRNLCMFAQLRHANPTKSSPKSDVSSIHMIRYLSFNTIASITNNTFAALSQLTFL